MTHDQARRILSGWRPGIPVDDDPELGEAVKLAARDPELGRRIAEAQPFHDAVRRALREQPVPADLADRILAARKTLRPAFNFAPLVRAAAAVVLLLAGLTGVLLARRPAGPSDDFVTFRQRMVRTVVREYRMDVVTNDLAAIRGFMTAHDAPADFVLPPALATLPPIGGGLLSWQGRSVSMVCLDGGRLGTLFLFIVPADSVRAGRPEIPATVMVNRLATLGWTRGDRTYVLAANSSLAELQAFQ